LNKSPRQKKRRVLLAISGRAAMEQLIVPARHWRTNEESESIFWLAHPTDAAFSEQLSGEGFTLLGPGADRGRADPAGNIAPQPISTADVRRPGFLRNNRLADLARDILLQSRMVCKLRADRQELRLRLSEMGLDAIVTVQERTAYFLPLLAAAQDLQIPVVLVPPNYLCQPDGGAYMRRWDVRLRPSLTLRQALKERIFFVWMINKVIARYRPRQIFHSQEGDMLCYPGDYMLALATSGMLPPNIWHQGTRFVDRVVVSGNEETSVCLEAGIPAERIVKLGNPVFQALCGNTR
jgi:hypothetical protein